MRLLRLYRSKDNPGHWVGEDAYGSLMIWPATPRGWSKRTGYAGSKRQLEEVEPALARGTGWPGGGAGRRPSRGEASKPLTIRVTTQERGAWERAAKERDRALSDWIRDTCNAAAIDDTRPRAKGKP
jgi:hypothetical protein